ncbi:FAD:protein FMN transferase [Brevibacterium daeguense]|uniref:FAD:protein FMN transferase n=2 Tax=Brevibacterium daeguense TaxID=909936 RepID=A0ABP8EGB4_9MICO
MRDPAPTFHAARFRAIGAEHEILCSEESARPIAVAIAEDLLAELDSAASRFHVSELDSLNRAALHGPVTAEISPLLAEVLRAALWAAADTGGLNDPTLGAGLLAAGYDVDIDAVRSRAPHEWAAWVPPVPSERSSGWQNVELRGRRLTLPAGTLLDVGSIGKAFAADAIAARCDSQLPGAFVVNCGGDIALAGLAPSSGVPLGIMDAHDRLVDAVELSAGGMATSSTQLRRWQRDGRSLHHIIDPRSGEPALPVWHTATVTAASAVAANAASTAAIVLGDAAPDWLAGRDVHALLVGADRRTAIRWPTTAVPNRCDGVTTEEAAA